MTTATARVFTFLTTAFSLLYPSRSLPRRLSTRRHSCLLLLYNSRLSLPPFLTPLLSPSSNHLHSKAHSLGNDQLVDSISSSSSFAAFPASHPWPEWSKFLHRLHGDGYFDGTCAGVDVYEFIGVEALPDGFLRAANACMAFARRYACVLGLLSKKDVEAVVENGSPFLFRNAQESIRRMKAFLRGGKINVPEYDRPSTVDLMRYLLSYASAAGVSSEANIISNSEVVESSVRNLFVDLVRISGTSQGSFISGTNTTDSTATYEQTLRYGQNIEMKSGGWICQRCNFMNFARSMKCLECDASHPKRQLTGGEWECPQCDFFNYGRNVVCLKCDCKKPGIDSFKSAPMFCTGYVEHSENSDTDIRVVENEGKEQPWFSKISQLVNMSVMSNGSADETFPEIMPMRKSVNSFDVSTRKTPVESKLADEHYRRTVGNDGTPSSHFQAKVGGKSFNEKINQKLDEMLGHRSPVLDMNHSSGFGNNIANGNPFPTTSSFWQQGNPSNNNSGHVAATSSSEQVIDHISQISKTQEVNSSPVYGKAWGHNAFSNVDFPKVMPLHRSVLSKQKDPSSTSPVWERCMAMEQEAAREGKVPFVPSPPGYFAKGKQQEGSDSTNGDVSETYPMPKASEATVSANRNNVVPLDEFHPATVTSQPPRHDEDIRGASRMRNPISRDINANQFDGKRVVSEGYSTSGDSTKDSWSNSSSQVTDNPSIRDPWKRSLEGSAMKETDPLDMSEEAKTERWLRLVSQIKDISELSQIPDEDFPSIMPMRKGVNRFVVSKRKTPLERRLTSSQYRRNLPVVNSDPQKKENEMS